MDLISLSRKELLEECSRLGYKNYKSKSKNDLIGLLSSSIKIHLKPLIKWCGGKSEEIKLFEKHIPLNFDKYIELFAGGASLYFYLRPEKAILNDTHKELIDFYKAIKDGYRNDIIKFMDDNKNDEETYYRIRDNEEFDYINRAKRFYYIRKTCFRGMMRVNKKGHFNIPFGKYKSINYDDLKNSDYEDLLKSCEIFNEDYKKILEENDDENNFIFIDPPYDSSFKNYGFNNFTKENHIELAELFKKNKSKCLIIIGKTDFIVDLYKEYIVDEYDKKYKFKLYDNRIGDEINNKHLIIKNFS